MPTRHGSSQQEYAKPFEAFGVTHVEPSTSSRKLAERPASPSDKSAADVGAEVATGGVLLVTPWYGGSAGGVAISVETVAASLMELGLSVDVLVLNGGVHRIGRFGERISYLTVYDRTVRATGLKGWLGYYRRMLNAGRTLRRLTRDGRNRVVHFHFCVPTYDPIRFWLKVLRIPFMVTFRGSDINQLEAGSVAEADVGRIIDDSRIVAAVSDGLMAEVTRRFPQATSKSVVVRNVVPIDVWRSARASGAPVVRDIDVLFLGNIQHIKGPDLLMSAFEKLWERLPDATLYFVGTGTMEAEVREMVRNSGHEKQVMFAGRATRSEVPDWLRRARVLALPSRAEGLPLAAVEAQLLGVPVVAFAVGGVPQAIADGQTGCLVAPGDTGAFCDAVARLLSNEHDWSETSQNAERWARMQFDPARMAKEYVSLYETLAAYGS